MRRGQGKTGVLKIQFGSFGYLSISDGDVLGLNHQIQHTRLARFGPVGIQIGIVNGG